MILDYRIQKKTKIYKMVYQNLNKHFQFFNTNKFRKYVRHV